MENRRSIKFSVDRLHEHDLSLKAVVEADIDLKEVFAAAGTEIGVFHLSGGEIGYTSALVNEDGTFDLRYEEGWYCTYLNNGIRPVAGVIHRNDGTKEEIPGGNQRNIVKFEAMTWGEAKTKYPSIEGGFHP